jgi:hypothetical protein
LANQLARPIDRSVRLKKRAAVGKGIGRYIKYGHQLCLTLECQQSFSGSPNHFARSRTVHKALLARFAISRHLLKNKKKGRHVLPALF